MQKKCYFFLSLAIVFLTANTLIAHPLYISLCDVTYHAETKELDLTFTLFTEDLEAAIIKKTNRKAFLGTANQSSDGETEILAYLKSQAEVKIDLAPISLDSLSYEITVGEVRTTISFTVEDIQTFREMTLKNQVFFELFEEQRNMLRVKKDGKKKSLLLTTKKPAGTIFF